MPSFSFSYSISRPYPFKWFNWVVLVGGICAAVLFSSINIAANGYNLAIKYSTDYNGTVSAKRWTRHFPYSAFEKSVASCQAHDVAVSSQFFTDKLSLPYTLVSVWQTQNGRVSFLPSLKYVNNALENCAVSVIELDLESFQRPASQQAWTTWSPKASAQLTCSVQNDAVPTFFNLTVDYEFVSKTIASGAAYSFLQPKSNISQASLWWGESLLSWYSLNLAAVMRRESALDNTNIIQGSLVYMTSGNTSDISRLDFFNLWGYDFVVDVFDGDGRITQLSACCMDPAESNKSEGIGEWAAQGFSPNIWIQSDSLAKAFYATIMADVGQVGLDNILSNSTLLEYFTTNITSMIGYTSGVETPWLRAGPARKPYNEIKDETGPLNVTVSYIYTQYLCQVPELKSTGALLIAVLLADLVFLQALWQLLTWGTTLWLERKTPHARYCEGCLRHLQGSPAIGGEIELSPTVGSEAEVSTMSIIRHVAMSKDVQRKPSSMNARFASSESRQGLLGTSMAYN